MQHAKPLGYWKCRACGTVCQGQDLYQDPQSTVLKWTCSDLFCGGTCDNLDPKYIVAKLNEKYKLPDSIQEALNSGDGTYKP